MLVSKIALSQIMLPAYQGVVAKIPAIVTPSFSCGPSTVSDIDGNLYNTVLIGTQCWMASNIKVTRYSDGTTIPDQTANTNWGTLLTGARTVYTGEASYLATYGYLYNWYAAKGIITSGVSPTKNICHTGWHVPTDAEWTIMIQSLDPSQAVNSGNVSTFNGIQSYTAGGKIKTTGYTYWNTPNTGATNESGFSALPGGTRHINGSFYNVRLYALFWSATEYDGNSAWSNHVKSSNGNVHRGSGNKSSGFSVRCLRY